MKDFLGNEYGVGDTVLYAAMNGRSATMVKAQVLDIGEKSIKLQPLGSSRWDQHGSTRYVDARTGKAVRPFSVRPAIFHYTHRETGETMTAKAYQAKLREIQATRFRTWGEQIDTHQAFHSVWRLTWPDWLKVEQVVKPVHITVIENIVKIP